jgi:hypothetical protein
MPASEAVEPQHARYSVRPHRSPEGAMICTVVEGRRTSSASMGIAVVLLPSDGRGRRRPGRSHRAAELCRVTASGSDRLLIRPAWWARPMPAPQQTAHAKGSQLGASCTTSHAAMPAPEPDSDPPGPPPPHSQLRKRRVAACGGSRVVREGWGSVATGTLIAAKRSRSYTGPCVPCGQRRASSPGWLRPRPRAGAVLTRTWNPASGPWCSRCSPRTQGVHKLADRLYSAMDL